jgi:hypothetical protein
MNVSKSNAPKKNKQGEPKQRVSSTEKKPLDVPMHKQEEESRGERGLPVKNSTPSYPAI